MSKFRISYNESGKPLEIHYNKGSDSPMWATLPFIASSKTFSPKNEIDQILLSEAQALPEWATLNLSDRPPTPVILPPDFATFARIVERSSFWKGKIRKTLQDKAFTELVNMMGVIAIAGTTPERIQDLLSLWNEVVASLSVGVTIAASDITFLNTTATDNRVPILFASNGTASVRS